MFIIFIAGLPRSGTTFLQSQLLQYENVVALGEVSQTIIAIKNIENYTSKWKTKLDLRKQNYWNPETYPILLGKIDKDSFWSSIKKEIEMTEDITSAIEIVYLRAREKYPDHVIIDSSKHLSHLKRVKGIEQFNNLVKVILCIRDYRGWMFSIKKHRKRINIPQRGELVEIYKWLYSNKRLIKYISSSFDKSHQIISYDKLMFQYSDMMEKIADFCNLQKSLVSDSKMKFHEILGSQSFKSSREGKDFLYDSEWFSYSASCMEKPVSKFNSNIYLKYSI